MAGALIRKQDAVAARQATKRFYFTDHVTVIVGRGRHEKSFMAHADVLSKSCLFFEEACISSAEEEKILLPEVEDHRTFNYFLQWAYTGKIVFLGMDDLGELKYVVHCLKFAIHLYEFGIQLRSIALRNAAVDTFLDVLSSAKRIPQAAIVAQLWSSTPPGCKLQQLVLNWGVHHLQASWLEQHRPRLPDAFLADLSINFARQNEDPFQTLASDPLITQKHHYHEGIIGVDCCCTNEEVSKSSLILVTLSDHMRCESSFQQQRMRRRSSAKNNSRSANWEYQRTQGIIPDCHELLHDISIAVVEAASLPYQDM